MLQKQIAVGGVYMAKISGKVVPCRVDRIEECRGVKGNQTHYYVTNTITGRHTMFRSATKFRRVATSTIDGAESPMRPAGSRVAPGSMILG